MNNLSSNQQEVTTRKKHCICHNEIWMNCIIFIYSIFDFSVWLRTVSKPVQWIVNGFEAILETLWNFINMFIFVFPSIRVTKQLYIGISKRSESHFYVTKISMQGKVWFSRLFCDFYLNRWQHFDGSYKSITKYNMFLIDLKSFAINPIVDHYIW